MFFRLPSYEQDILIGSRGHMTLRLPEYQGCHVEFDEGYPLN